MAVLTVRFFLAVLLNGVLINLAGLLHSRTLLAWPVGALIIGALFVVPWTLIRSRSGATTTSDAVIVKNGVAWVLGGFVPLEVIYSIVVRPARLPLILLATLFFFLGGAIAGFSGWVFYHLTWRRTRDER